MKYTLLLFLFLVSAVSIQAQTNPDSLRYRIETNDGNNYIGTIVMQDATTITLRTDQLGVISLPKSNIRSMDLVSGTQGKDGSYWFDNPQSSRYFIQSNGYGVKAGEGYYQNAWIFFNQVNFGITDNFQIGAGLMPLFLFAGAPSPVWLNPKFSIPVAKDRFNLGIGALVGTVIGAETPIFGLLHGTGTVGTRDRNISLGIGFGYADGELTDVPAISLSGMWRTGEKGYLLTENYYINAGGETLLMLFVGGRRMIKRANLDFGVMMPTQTGEAVFIPWLGIGIPFGKG
jgi:hypothetical protein